MHNSLQTIENMQVAYQPVSLTFIVVNRVVCLEGQEKVIAVRDSVLLTRAGNAMSYQPNPGQAAQICLPKRLRWRD
jgi:hypothetical protein